MIDPLLLHEKGLVYCDPHFLDREQCQALLRDLEQRKTVDSSTYFEHKGHTLHPFRSSREIQVEVHWYRVIQQQLMAQQAFLADYFQRPLAKLEPLQFLKYEPGDYFKIHNDRNQALASQGGIHGREVSLLLYLNSYLRPQEEPGPEMLSPYSGGELVFYFDFSRSRRGFPIATSAGMLLAFDPDTLHEVRSVQQGTRYAVVSWFHGPVQGAS